MMDRLSRLKVYESGLVHIGLTKNYRSHPGILLAPSTMFYRDKLEPYADLPRARWSGLPNRHVPVKVIGVESSENWVDEGASYYNLAEIDIVLKTVDGLLGDKELSIQQKEIGVISPWREQVWRLRDALRARGMWNVNVGHVEAFQGAEYRAIILSCVRSDAGVVERDKAAGMGLIFEPKRYELLDLKTFCWSIRPC